MVIISFIILLIFCSVILFLKYWIPFGKIPSQADRQDYSLRFAHFKKKRFYNEHDYQLIYKHAPQNYYISNKSVQPLDKIPVQKTSINKNPNIQTLSITWLGHSSIYIQMHGMNILIDPIFSEYASPFSFFGAHRFSQLPLSLDELTNIDIVLITHDHYDHLDYQTIKKIDKKVNKYVVPLGVENHLKKWGVSSHKIIHLAWWENTNINGLHIICTPARHNSSRNFILDRYKTLWASWVLIDDNYKVFDSGDTGFDNHFENIHDKYGDFDLAILECGQYNTRWKSTHMIPEESVRVGQILNAKMIMPMHWGSFHLAEHPWDDSIERFVLKAEQENMRYMTPMIGENIEYSNHITTDKWWKNIK